MMLFSALPVRLTVGIMMFLACFVNYMSRVNISIIIIAMVPQNSTSTSVKSECDALKDNNTNDLYSEWSELSRNWQWRQRKDAVVLNWTAAEQGYVLSGYFWGYAITCFLGGMVVEFVGPRLLIFSTTLLCGVLSILSPQAAQLHYIALVLLRFIMGCASGFLFPALHDLLVRWAPPDEKGKFVSALIGGAIGTVFTWSLIGSVIDRFGWDYAFYISGTIVIVWSLIWWYLVYDSPVCHPRISNNEKQYILKAIGNKVEHTVAIRPTPPYKNIFTSLPFLAMVILHYGNSWGFYFMMTAAPKYVSSALGFQLTSTGVLASLPYLARMIFSLGFGAIGDRIIRIKWIPATFVRKFFCLFSHVIPGLLLCALGYTGCSPILSIALITLTFGFNSAVTLTSLVNHHDLAPNFAAPMYGIANGIAITAGWITPLVTAHFTKNGNGFAEWRPVFITGGVFYIATAVYFVVFGTTETQPWNYIATSPDEKHSQSNASSER